MFTDFYAEIMEIIIKGQSAVHGWSMGFLSIMLMVDFALFVIYMMMGHKAQLSHILMQILKMGVFIYVLDNFMDIIDAFRSLLFQGISKVYTGISATAEVYNTDPGNLIIWANENIVDALWESMEARLALMSWGDIGSGIFLGLIFMLAYVVVMVVFIYIALQLAIATIEMNLTFIMSTLLMPFSAFELTQFVGAKAIPAALGQAIKLAIIYIVIGIGMQGYLAIINEDTINALRNVNPFNRDGSGAGVRLLVSIVGATLLFGYLVKSIPALATSFLTGIPGLSFDGFKSAAEGFIGGAKNIAQGIGSGISSIGSAIGSTGKDGGGGGGSSGSDNKFDMPNGGGSKELVTVGADSEYEDYEDLVTNYDDYQQESFMNRLSMDTGKSRDDLDDELNNI